jgi:thiol-disulfide isomerase/thioredoxin
MKRRGLLLGGVAAASLAGGAFWAAQRRDAGAEEAAALWSSTFEQPGGGTLSMAALRGRPLVVNFWATWCPPCVKEMPQLDRFHKQYSSRGWQVVGLAIDNAKAVEEFLRKTPVGFPIGLGGLHGTQLARALGNVHGALPFTAVFAANGRKMHAKMGETSFEELAGWADTAG